MRHELRWILLANHCDPVQGLLRRFLRRRLVANELAAKTRDRDMARIVDWMPRCWAHLNRFLETHHSAQVTIGPRWFLQVPADSTCSQVRDVFIYITRNSSSDRKYFSFQVFCN